VSAASAEPETAFVHFTVGMLHGRTEMLPGSPALKGRMRYKLPGQYKWLLPAIE